MKLHYHAIGDGYPIILIHGLFGSGDNLDLISRALKDKYKVINVDLRNHGLSPHSDQFTYQQMAQDVLDMIDELSIDHFAVIGHSMGGKVAMSLTELASDRIDHLVVLDISPVAYSEHRHQNVFAGLREVSKHIILNRKEAEQYLALHVQDPGVRQFLLKSLTKTENGYQWRFNVEGLIANYQTIMGWYDITPFTGKTLFMKGQDSEYITPDYREAIMRQFPNAKAHLVANTGHWLHAEKPETVNRVIEQFLQK